MYSLRGIIRIVVMGGALLLSITHLAHGERHPIKVEITSVTGATITLGEPVVMQYSLTNTTDHELSAFTGKDAASWYQATLADDKGVEAPPLKSPSVPDSPVYSTGPRLRQNETYTGYIIVSDRFAVPEAGVYTLHFKTNLLYSFGATEFTDTPKTMGKQHQIVEDGFTYRMTVLPKKNRTLRNVALGLKRSILGDKIYDHREMLIESLFSMPEDQAHWTWEELTSDSRIKDSDIQMIALELIRLQTPESADILYQLLWNPPHPLDQGVKSQLQVCMMQLYGGSNGLLKEHIKTIYAAHGVSLPNKIIVPRGID